MAPAIRNHWKVAKTNTWVVLFNIAIIKTMAKRECLSKCCQGCKRYNAAKKRQALLGSSKSQALKGDTNRTSRKPVYHHRKSQCKNHECQNLGKLLKPPICASSLFHSGSCVLNPSDLQGLLSRHYPS